MLNCISHFQRLNTKLPLPEPHVKKPTVRCVRVQSVDENSRIVRTKIEKITVDRANEMKPYRVSDFSLDNLIAVGATLSATHLSASPHQAITDMAATLDSIDLNYNQNE